MRVAVELTYDDFAEASAAARAVVAEKQRRKVQRSPLLVVASVLLGLAVGFALVLAPPSRLDPHADLRPPLFWPLTMGLPVIVILIFVGVLAAVQRAPGSKPLAALAGWGLFIAVGLLFVLLQLRSAPPAGSIGDGDGSRHDWFGTLVPHSPWILITAILAGVAARSVRVQTRLAWEAYSLHLRRKVYDVTAEGVSVDEGVSRAQYAWAAFARFEETPNLMLLCPTDLTFEILPKRAFASAEELTAARHLFTRMISEPTATATQAFPVGATPAAPAPVQQA